MATSNKLHKLKETAIRAAAKAGEGHIPSALSILDILWVLYDQVLTYNPKDANDPANDHFILSKGHASLGLYSVLAEKGLIDVKELETFGAFDSKLGGHPDRNKIPWVEASTGSLGHGFPIAVGIALGLKIQKKNNRVFAIIGDGESNEGSIWEAALLANHHSLNNLCCIVDYNHSTDRALEVGDLVKKFESFGWKAVSVDGHDQIELAKVLGKESQDQGKPLAVIANTIKGYGIKSMEHNPAWHHRSPSAEEIATIVKELYQNE